MLILFKYLVISGHQFRTKLLTFFFLPESSSLLRGREFPRKKLWNVSNGIFLEAERKAFRENGKVN